MVMTVFDLQLDTVWVGDNLRHQVDRATAAATELLGAEIVYDSDLFQKLALKDFEERDYRSNDIELVTRSLDVILEDRCQVHRMKGLAGEALTAWLEGVPNAHAVTDLLQHGARDFTSCEFVPNGGRECSVGGSYLKYRPICNDAILELVNEGRAIAFSRDAMEASGQMEKVHVSPLVWAPKANKVKGRTCMHLSKASKNFPSVNESVDVARSERLYPKPSLPLLPDVAEMACRQRDACGGAHLSGATVDVSSAYHQFAQSAKTALYQATLLRVPAAPWSGREWIQLIVIYLVGVFGFIISGSVYCTLGAAIEFKHNVGQPTPRSLTYIDDGILISPSERIDESREQYIQLVIDIFGPDGVNRKKIKTWAGRLEAIGWDFDFGKWTVQPSMRGLAKLIFYLFKVLPVGATIIHEKDLERMCGVLSWYASGLPSGSAFTASLFVCKRRVGEKSHRIQLSALAMRDVAWWRAIVLASWLSPHTMAADISAKRRNLEPSRFLRTDASSLIGGGGALSIVKGGAPMMLGGDAIRWTRREAEAFQAQGVSINVLEYFVGIYYIMLWAGELRGRCVQLECDNTAAVSWIMKQRAVRGSPTLDCLVKLFSLFVLRENITVIASHIAGVLNVLADFLSRDLDHCAQESDEGIVISEDGKWFENCSRAVACRRLLYVCVTMPEEMHGPNLAGALTALLSGRGPPTATSQDKKPTAPTVEAEA